MGKSEKSDSASSSNEKEHKREHKSKKSEESKQKLAQIEAKVKEKFVMKSDKFQAFDMFAPKTPKIKKPLIANLSQTGSSPSNQVTTTMGSKSVPSSPATPSSMSSTKPVFPAHEKKVSTPSNTSQNSTGSVKKEIHKSSMSSNEKKSVGKSHKKSSSESSPFIVHEPRVKNLQKIYPELPVPQTEGIDKERQHQDDMLETKRRLEEARQRKMAEIKKEKE